MATEYFAFITEEDYPAFQILVTTPLPGDYDMWLRVRDRGKLRAMERAAAVIDIEITPTEFGAYCKQQMRRRDFSIAALDLCAREKGLTRHQGRASRSTLAASSRWSKTPAQPYGMGREQRST
jgi:hypothetical protein